MYIYTYVHIYKYKCMCVYSYIIYAGLKQSFYRYDFSVYEYKPSGLGPLINIRAQAQYIGPDKP